MSTYEDNHFNANTTNKARSPQKQSSILLFDEDQSYTPLTHQSRLEQDITAVSLSVDSLDAKIPTLTPKTPEPAPHEESTQELKVSQLHYLEANNALTKQAISEAETASKILTEAKATQLNILERLEESKEDTIECKKNISILESGLKKCEKILRESRFIQNEIEKLYHKTQKQDVLEPNQRTIEVTRLAAELQEAQKTLDSVRESTSGTYTESRKTLEQIHEELAACHNTRIQMESKKEFMASELHYYKEKIDSITQEALSLIQSSEENLSTSKTGQTSYLALSREITALRQELKNYKQDTTDLSINIKSANKAIALNKTAVETLTNDLMNIKQNIHIAKKSSTMTSLSTPESQPEMNTLLKETQATHKRINQLLELNNTVSDRINKVDKAIGENALKQDAVTAQQQQALKDIDDQRKACQKLIEQANRSHTLIVSACKKTALLADEIDETTHEEQKHRNAILNALKDHRCQKKSLHALQASLEHTHQKQVESLSHLEQTHQALQEDDKKNQKLLEELNQKSIILDEITPQIYAQKTQADDLLSTLSQTIENNKNTNQALQTLQSKMTDQFAEHKAEQHSMQNTILEHIQEYKKTSENLHNQQDRLKNVEQDFAVHIQKIDSLSQKIQHKLQDLATQQASNQVLSKDIDYSKTELRYLKDQCEQLLKECISQSRISKKNEDTTTKSIQTLTTLENTVKHLIEHQQDQELGLDQLNTLVNNALNELNTKLDQFQHIQNKTQKQNTMTGELQKKLHNTTLQQKENQKEITHGLNTLFSQIEHIDDQKNQLESLKQTLYTQMQDQAKTIDIQNQKINEQNTIIVAQSSLLEDVKNTHDQTQKSLETIEHIRKKAQQSFAHLGVQKTKFETSFAQSFEKLKQQDEQQKKQDNLLKETESVIQYLKASTQRADAFEQWQQDTTQDINSKLQQIDEYQSRAFHAQKASQAKENQLEEQYQEFQGYLDHLQKVMQSLDTTRLEEAQYRDELRALVHHHERQQEQVEHQLSESQNRHDSLTRSLEDAHLMFRENKLATKETQMANRETKLILQEIRKEISSLKQSGWQLNNREQWESEERIEALEAQLNRPCPEEQDTTPSSEHKIKPYKPSSFML